jgi:hypothetical protein
MGDAKRLLVQPIASEDARRIIRKLHYSGKVVDNSQLHLGVFLDGKCGGAMSFGPPLDKRKILGLVRDTPWNGMLELNRMAFADWLPRNGESRALGYAFRWMRTQYPQIAWVVSFADGCQCGDGTIYRASGFVLTGIKRNTQIWKPPGEADAIFSCVSLTDNHSHQEQARAKTLCRVSATKGAGILRSASMRPGIDAIGTAASPGGGSSMRAYIDAGFEPLPGFQLRYMYFLDPTARDRLTVPVLPFSAIDAAGARMYRGQQQPPRGKHPSDAPGVQPGEGDATSTPVLHPHD